MNQELLFKEVNRMKKLLNLKDNEKILTALDSIYIRVENLENDNVLEEFLFKQLFTKNGGLIKRIKKSFGFGRKSFLEFYKVENAECGFIMVYKYDDNNCQETGLNAYCLDPKLVKVLVTS